VAGAKGVVARTCKAADALTGGIPRSWIVARYAVVAGPDHHLTRGQYMRMDWKKWQIRTHIPTSDHRLLCDPLPRAEAHPDHYATMRLNATRWYSLSLVFIAVSRLASLRAESHIRFALRCWDKHEDPERLLVDRVVVFTDCQDDPLTIDRDCLSEHEP
jgi:hypothetical protein